MSMVEEKFKKLGVENAPGQELLQKGVKLDLKGEKILGEKIDFSHGDVDAHKPLPNSLELFIEGFNKGGIQAYTEYKGNKEIREYIAGKLSEYIKMNIPADNLIITPGTQGALFLATGSLITRGTKVSIVEPDYFANRKLVEFFEGEIVSIELDYFNVNEKKAGLNLKQLEEAFKSGVELFLFSNPNNPTGVIYSDEEITEIARLVNKYNVTVIADELYSRQIFDNREFYHLITKNINQDKLITIIGPSKTESLSGFRLGIAYGSPTIIKRMEKLQAITTLRTAGYNQAVLKSWFSEPDGFMRDRIEKHQAIRDNLIEKFKTIDGVKIRKTEAGSYIFPTLPELEVNLGDFVKILRIYANVIVTPGTEFGKSFINSIRLNFSQDEKKAAEGVDRILEMIRRYKK
ncbi:pyridoxal phosphate-dependent aminotransferase [Fusobacterium nucleatum]|uniref:pyridoxal phosphate-dependent aminotransferase n=1 Tax=Fusobacterium nucleatum TaxID=851 RepID=UPI001EEF18D4|nr:pyridoxal phosphate-dependent aminotransferase [Fusobacterium nucleatum]MCG6843185.1 pyridoxal phosphate-dependent aminotransferase [Fusobacterium nucleatum]